MTESEATIHGSDNRKISKKVLTTEKNGDRIYKEFIKAMTKTVE